MLVDSDSPGVTVYRRESEGGFRAERYDGMEETILLPEIEVDLRLGEIYERVEFED